MPLDVPCFVEVYKRMAADEEFFTRIARAREAQQHAVVDEMVAMADAATPENWQVIRLQIWARQWTAAKLASRYYGEKIATQNLDKNGNPTDPPVPAVAISINRDA